MNNNFQTFISDGSSAGLIANGIVNFSKNEECIGKFLALTPYTTKTNFLNSVQTIDELEGLLDNIQQKVLKS